MFYVSLLIQWRQNRRAGNDLITFIYILYYNKSRNNSIHSSAIGRIRNDVARLVNAFVFF